LPSTVIPSHKGVEYRVEGFVTDRLTIAAAIGKDRAKQTARLVRLSYDYQSAGATNVMLGGPVHDPGGVHSAAQAQIGADALAPQKVTLE
jgi:hypothetical protein